MSDTTTSDVTVLFILGKGRSGSTILDNLLGQIDGVFTAGELVHLWDWGFEQGVRCGCGEHVARCPIWSEVLARLPGAPARGHEEVLALQRRVIRWHHAPRLHLASRDLTRRRWRALREWSELKAQLYRAVRDVTGSDVIVDASKIPLEPAMLGYVPGIRPRLLQLVRDPRAVVHSWKREKAFTDRDSGAMMPTYGAAYSTMSWTVRNLVVELLRRTSTAPSLLLRYEDFAADPTGAMRRILELVDLDPDLAPTGPDFEIAENHTVGGNPDRVGRRSVTIREDTEWRASLPRRDALVSTALAAPLLARYGYPLRTTTERYPPST